MPLFFSTLLRGLLLASILNLSWVSAAPAPMNNGLAWWPGGYGYPANYYDANWVAQMNAWMASQGASGSAVASTGSQWTPAEKIDGETCAKQPTKRCLPGQIVNVKVKYMLKSDGTLLEPGATNPDDFHPMIILEGPNSNGVYMLARMSSSVHSDIYIPVADVKQYAPKNGIYGSLRMDAPVYADPRGMRLRSGATQLSPTQLASLIADIKSTCRQWGINSGLSRRAVERVCERKTPKQQNPAMASPKPPAIQGGGKPNNMGSGSASTPQRQGTLQVQPVQKLQPKRQNTV